MSNARGSLFSIVRLVGAAGVSQPGSWCGLFSCALRAGSSIQFLSSLPCAALSKLKHFQLGRLAGGNEEEGFHLVRLVVFALRMWSVGRSVS